MNTAISKKLIAASFSRAAERYDDFADLQRHAVDQLLGRIDRRKAVTRILDIGSGTGYCSGRLREAFPDAELVNMDIAPGMLRFSKRHGSHEKDSWVCADAEHLPFADDSFDLMFSSLAIQWCSDYHRLFADVARVTVPRAQCLFTTFGDATLQELRQAWARVDGGVHVNAFMGAHSFSEILRCFPLKKLSIEQEKIVRHYDSVAALGRELKAIGANNMNPGQPPGLTGRAKLKRLEQAFMEQADPVEGRGVTWELLCLDFCFYAPSDH